MLLAAAAASFICGHAYAGAKAVIGGAFANQLLDAKTAVGKDGLLRLLFDYNPSVGGTTYAGSALWIIDPNGGLVAAGNPTIPASVGSFYFSTPGGKPIFPSERSRTVLFPQADGNTTVIFFYSLTLDGTKNFATWTYNSGGALIAAATYGPFPNILIENLYFDTSGKIVVKFATTPNPSLSGSFAGWVLDEFGTIVSATSFYGPFAPFVGKFRLTSQGQLIWPFSFQQNDGTTITSLWTFNSSGSAIAHAQSYGPF
jgi:hypothetical protein